MNNNEIINKLSETQRKICMHDKGFALVLAGPGSGKTTVTVTRICMLTTKYERPERILCQTFTVAAANEMRSRYMQYIGDTILNNKISKTPHFSTIHSFCLGLLHQYAISHSTKYAVIDGMQVREIIKDIYIQINNKTPDDSTIDSLVSAISAARTRKGAITTQVKNFHKIVEQYQTTKKANSMIDYDDMIFLTLDILNKDKTFRESIQNRYDYILLDEAQDMTKTQFDIIRHIAPDRNIFVVADDDQSIYGFRGADPTELMQFVESYGNVNKYYLEQNYRSQASIVDLSVKIIGNNKRRYKKNLYTDKKATCKVDILHFPDNIMQAMYVCKMCNKQQGTTAVLYRNNASGLLLRAAMITEGINYKIAEGTIRTQEIPLVNKYVDTVRKMQQEAHLIIPSPERIFTRMVWDGLEQYADEYCEITGQMKHYKNQVLSFLKYISSTCSSYGQLIKLLDMIDNDSQSHDTATVVLSTIHSSKGLEYDNVFIIDLIYDEFPGQNVVTEDRLEEERRLFYVAITRAKDKLTLCYPEKCFTTKEVPSIFVEESRRALRTCN